MPGEREEERMMTMGEAWTRVGSAMTSLMVIWAMFEKFFPYHLRRYLETHATKLASYLYPYIVITFPEYAGDRFNRSEAYLLIQSYLSAKSSAEAKRLKADERKGSKSLVLSIDDHEAVTDEFRGVKVQWVWRHVLPPSSSMPFQYNYRGSGGEKSYYTLKFHKRDREVITGSYLDHVLAEGKVIARRNRQRKLYTNNPSQNWHWWRESKWNHVNFEHPATFETLAMETKKKEDIKKDLIKFRKGKEYYAKIGKPWKRGYLLYGPPGTGKSTMIAAMANFLEYDVYDLELTAVKDNTELRRLLIETSSQSIIVIEDIDCSLDLTGQRKKEKKDEDKSDDPTEKSREKYEGETSKVTLSGLLNFIDGIWSACGGERVIVFTTNFVDKLDPALIRRGRMDKHIEMSYCSFEAFQVLARNYLDIEHHELFADIERLLKEVDITPADVAENLLSESEEEEKDEEACLKSLIAAVTAEKEKAQKRAEEEARSKAETEEDEKGNSEHNGEKSEVKSGEKVKENGSVHQEKKT